MFAKRSSTGSGRGHGQLAAALVLVSMLLGAQQGSSQMLQGVDAPPQDSSLQGLWSRGAYDQARQMALRHDDTASLLIRAQLAIYDGAHGQAQNFATAALASATSPAQQNEAEVFLARLERARGERDQAEQRLRRVLAQSSAAYGARVELGELLIERGRRREAEVILEGFQSSFNNALIKTSSDLTHLGRAMVLLGGFSDANYAFERAIRLDPTNTEAIVAQGELFLSKYNATDAEEAFEAALKINAHHPDALVALARLEMTTSNQFDKMHGYLDRAQRVARHHPPALLARAELAIYDGDCTSALASANTVLSKYPGHLGAKTIVAACHYLSDDLAAFEKTRAEVLALRPDYARLLTETARYGLLVHRYEEAVALYREALLLDEGDAEALLGLGIGLSRIGKEDEALDVLRLAFAADSYNVRAYNMLEFYEKVMPDFVFTEMERYQLRAHKSQYEAIEALVDPVVKASMVLFDKKYGFKPDDYLAVEIYHEPTSFAVRSVGLPNISPHGICFGKVVLSRSPSEGNFNWRQVIWHEMAHVYHIQLAGSRVPRWFTEGLAEYETNVKDEAWNRYYDREIAAVLFGGTLASVVDFNKGFTHAKSMQDVVVAYQLASLAIHYIAETHGFEAIVKILRAYRDRLDTTAAFEQVLGQTPQAFDQGFRVWLERRMMGFRRQLNPDMAQIGDVASLQEQVRLAPDDALGWAHLAVAHVRAGEKPAALKALETAVQKDKDDPTIRFLGAHVLLWTDRVRDAYTYGVAVLDAKRDGYDLRLLLGRAAIMAEDNMSAQVHLGAATELFPNGYEAWQLLVRVAQLQKDTALGERAARRVFELDQNDPVIARQATATALAAKDWPEAALAARRWIDIRPFDPQSHLALSQAKLGLGDLGGAEAAWAVLLRLDGRQRPDAYLKIIAQLREVGRDDDARRYADKGREAGVSGSRLDRALKAP
ncbi:MAG: tetratricopeptide repeat protein [Bradymonadaceae bacterium]|nr:tetratricopeptide repeat protein [Lujinxingiaceae bacterium]